MPPKKEAGSLVQVVLGDLIHLCQTRDIAKDSFPSWRLYDLIDFPKLNTNQPELVVLKEKFVIFQQELLNSLTQRIETDVMSKSFLRGDCRHVVWFCFNVLSEPTLFFYLSFAKLAAIPNPLLRKLWQDQAWKAHTEKQFPDLKVKLLHAKEQDTWAIHVQASEEEYVFAPASNYTLPIKPQQITSGLARGQSASVYQTSNNVLVWMEPTLFVYSFSTLAELEHSFTDNFLELSEQDGKVQFTVPDDRLFDLTQINAHKEICTVLFGKSGPVLVLNKPLNKR